jgi:alpha-L-rhamnosidase
MLLELSRNGRHDEAWRLVNLRTVPSWGYMVDMDATTIWERWDGYVKGRGFQDPGMNSFNHWAIGSVGEWVWRELAGIQPDDEHPGYKHFTIRPRPCPGLTWAKAKYDSIRGTILSDWRQDGKTLSLRVVIPPNTTATVYLPAKDAGGIMEGTQPAAKAPGVRRIVMEGDHAVLHVDSGDYSFSSTMK